MDRLLFKGTSYFFPTTFDFDDIPGPTLCSLPNEILDHIISQLATSDYHSTTYRDRQNTLITLSQVSRHLVQLSQRRLREVVYVRSAEQLGRLIHDMKEKGWARTVKVAAITSEEYDESWCHKHLEGVGWRWSYDMGCGNGIAGDDLMEFMRLCEGIKWLSIDLRGDYGWADFKMGWLEDIRGLRSLRVFARNVIERDSDGVDPIEEAEPLPRLRDVSYWPGTTSLVQRISMLNFFRGRQLERGRSLTLQGFNDKFLVASLHMPELEPYIDRADALFLDISILDPEESTEDYPTGDQDLELVEWERRNGLPHCLVSAFPRSLFDVVPSRRRPFGDGPARRFLRRIGDEMWRHIYHLRLVAVNYPPNSSRDFMDYDRITRSINSGACINLSSLYLPLHLRDAPWNQQMEVVGLVTACRARSIEVLYELQPVTPLDSSVSIDFYRRQHEVREQARRGQ
ncbi:hypothetical protein JCM5353_000541 [Sporobolomyces roseus]